ncbi:hypothetical protein ACFO0N_08765 [Halobium salinum]|uniref:Small CPxCG-related zinc finger protein n=1 Tax=Halobium salinum TaxID=1364940 RepID=A0ABD5PB50_9EURY|nr:hypothetical protein [Halobium salinum]
MIDLYCDDCGDAARTETKAAASSAGWTEVDEMGVSGPWGTEATGVCPDCSAAGG